MYVHFARYNFRVELEWIIGIARRALPVAITLNFRDGLLTSVGKERHDEISLK